MTVTTGAEMLGWIAEICARGVRRPGTEADRWVQGFVADAFRSFGLESVRAEPLELPVWTPGRATLLAWPGDRPAEAIELEGFPLPHSAPTEGVEGDLVSLDDGSDVAGHLALHRFALAQVPQAFFRALATDHYDPDGDFDDEVHVLPFGPLLQQVMDPAIDRGAAAFVGLLSGVPWETCGYYVPYDGLKRPIPGLWISAADAARLQPLLDAGPVRARIKITSTRELARSANVVGELPGASDEWVVVGTHHDAPWASAVEDASGVALLLAQARHWASIPREERPHNLLFVSMAGHMVDGAGTRSFIERHRDLLDRIVLEVHLEHVARAAKVDCGRLVPTDKPESRWWFTSPIPELEAEVGAIMRAEDLRRSLVLHPEALGPVPPTDGGFFHSAGVPLVNLLAAPMYLFDEADTIDLVHGPSLEPITRAASRLIGWTAGRTAAGMRASTANHLPGDVNSW